MQFYTFAVGNFLELPNEIVNFNVNLSGIPLHVKEPMSAIIAIYRRKNGAKMIFKPESEYESEANNSFVQSEQFSVLLAILIIK